MIRALALALVCASAYALKLPAGLSTTMGRRSAVGVGALLIAPRATFAAKKPAVLDESAQLAKDESALADENAVIKSLDAKINADRKRAFEDELQEKKLEEEMVDAMKRNDDAGAKKLSSIFKKLKEDEKETDKEVLQLQEKLSGELARKKKLEGDVKRERSDIVRRENEKEVAAEFLEATEDMLSAEDFAKLPPLEQKKLIAAGYKPLR